MKSNIYNSMLLILIGGIIYFLILIILKNELVLDGINKMKELLSKIKDKIHVRK